MYRGFILAHSFRRQLILAEKCVKKLVSLSLQKRSDDNVGNSSSSPFYLVLYPGPRLPTLANSIYILLQKQTNKFIAVCLLSNSKPCQVNSQ